MKKTAIFGIMGVLLVGVLSTMAFAMPFGGKHFMGQTEEMAHALESGDYDAYIGALDSADRQFMAHTLTEEQFNARAENYQQMQQRMQERAQLMENAAEAIQNHDYAAWVEAVSSMDPQPAILEMVNEDNFDKFVELQNARMSWDFETAKELSEELGISGQEYSMGFGRMKGAGKWSGVGNGRMHAGCPFSEE